MTEVGLNNSRYVYGVYWLTETLFFNIFPQKINVHSVKGILPLLVRRSSRRGLGKDFVSMSASWSSVPI